jgi:hypothetical protein
MQFQAARIENQRPYSSTHTQLTDLHLHSDVTISCLVTFTGSNSHPFQTSTHEFFSAQSNWPYMKPLFPIVYNMTRASDAHVGDCFLWKCTALTSEMDVYTAPVFGFGRSQSNVEGIW